MKVLQQCIYFPPEIGGLESHVYFLCRELARLGDKVTIVTSRSVRGTPSEEQIEGMRVIRTWFPGKHTVGWITHTLTSIPRYLPLAAAADVLHAQTFASAPPGMLAKRRYGKPLVLTLHTSHFLRLARRAAWRPILRRIVRAADWLLAASEEIRDVACELYAHPRAEALPNGVDTELFRPVAPALPAAPQGRRRLIVPRRLYAKNGVEYVVRALPLLCATHDVEALIVGDGPERARLESLARELGVADRAIFLGARPNDQMPALLASAELAVLPSLMEATSIAALEAMSCALPVAAACVGGLPELVADDVGTLFRPADPTDLGARVAALLERRDLTELGQRARARVIERWSVQRLAQRHREIYRTLLADAGRYG